MYDLSFIQSLLDGNFSKDFQRIVLTQLGDGATIKREGPGILSMSAGGQLHLKVLLTHELDIPATVMRMLYQKPGMLLEDEYFSRIEATDYSGDVWTCDRVHTIDNVNFGSNSGTVSAGVGRLERRFSPPEATQQHALQYVFPGEYPIPYGMSATEAGRFSESRLDLVLADGTQVLLHRQQSCMLLEAIRADQPVDERAVNRLIEAISIAVGRELRWIYRRCEAPAEVEVAIVSWSKADLDRHIWGTVPDGDPKAFVQFLHRYLALCAEFPISYFGSWRKILDAWHVAIVAAALPISVYIEGAVKELFPQYMQETEPVVDAAESMALHLESSGVAEDLIARGQGAIRQIKGKSVTTALKALAEEGWFKGELVQKWQDVRHKSAHGNDLTRDQERAKLEGVLDAILGCLQLFYVLLLIRMRFAEEFHDLSEQGFPKVRLDPKLLGFV